jgi:hypothetical protein
MKLVRRLSKFTFDKYALPTDSKHEYQAEQTRRDRMTLADYLATFADADGSRIFPSVARLSRKFGWSRRKTFYVLDALRTLGLLSSSGLSNMHGTKVRELHPEVFEQECKAPDPQPEQECKADVAGVQSTEGRSAKQGQQECKGMVAHDCAVDGRVTRTVQPSDRHDSGSSARPIVSPKAGTAKAQAEAQELMSELATTYKYFWNKDFPKPSKNEVSKLVELLEANPMEFYIWAFKQLTQKSQRQKYYAPEHPISILYQEYGAYLREWREKQKQAAYDERFGAWCDTPDGQKYLEHSNDCESAPCDVCYELSKPFDELEKESER